MKEKLLGCVIHVYDNENVPIIYPEYFFARTNHIYLVILTIAYIFRVVYIIIERI